MADALFIFFFLSLSFFLTQKSSSEKSMDLFLSLQERNNYSFSIIGIGS